MENNYQFTQEMYDAFDIITQKHENIFITGRAGTGKTNFMLTIKDALPKGSTVVLAPTGIAALNAHGQTIHSLFLLPFGPIAPKDVDLDSSMNELGLYSKQMKILRRLRYLIIDEVSMLRCDVLDEMNRKLQIVKKNIRPFGGVQLIMFGDLFQLPPVVGKDEQEILRHYYGNKGFYFFDAKVWKKVGFRVKELTKVFRQTDQTFIDFLNRVRDYKATQNDFSLINSRYCRDMWAPQFAKYIHLCSLREEVSMINEFKLKETRNIIYEFPVTITGNFPKSSLPCEEILKLSVGSRVMTLVNDSSEGRKYVNGSLGTIIEISNPSYINSIDQDDLLTDFEELLLQSSNKKPVIKVLLDSGETVDIGTCFWENIKYTLVKDQIKEEHQGSCEQYPIRLAWATTIHKSQGLTFDNIALHLGRIFSPGQLYVALSRCTNIGGIILDTIITPSMMQEDDLLLKFKETYENDNNFYIGQDINYDDDLMMD